MISVHFSIPGTDLTRTLERTYSAIVSINTFLKERGKAMLIVAIFLFLSKSISLKYWRYFEWVSRRGFVYFSIAEVLESVLFLPDLFVVSFLALVSS